MFHFFQHLAAKTLGVVASAIIAVGIVKIPQPLPPVVAQHHNVAITAVPLFITTATTPTSTLPTVIKKQNSKAPTSKSVATPPSPSPAPTPTPAQVQPDSNDSKTSATIVCNGKIYGNANCSAGDFLYCNLDGIGECVSPNETFCNGVYYTKCISGQFYCSATGGASCSADQTAPITSQPLQQNNQYLEQLRKQLQDERDKLQAQFDANTVALNNYFKAEDAIKQQITDEVKQAGGFITASQLEVMAIQRLKEQGISMPSAPIIDPIPTAICNDYTASYSQNNSGTCSDHGGVANWLY